MGSLPALDQRNSAIGAQRRTKSIVSRSKNSTVARSHAKADNLAETLDYEHFRTTN